MPGLLASRSRLDLRDGFLIDKRMRIVVQRVSEAAVRIEGETVGRIARGLLVLVGFSREETESELDWVAGKLIKLRLFADDAGVMNRSVEEVDGGLLLVSQFTLFASTKKGNRPSWLNAAPPEIAEPFFDRFVAKVRDATSQPVECGRFGADMQVHLINDGPVTVMIDSKLRE